jgi:hypothetical protein
LENEIEFSFVVEGFSVTDYYTNNTLQTSVKKSLVEVFNDANMELTVYARDPVTAALSLAASKCEIVSDIKSNKDASHFSTAFGTGTTFATSLATATGLTLSVDAKTIGVASTADTTVTDSKSVDDGYIAGAALAGIFGELLNRFYT